MKFLIGSTNPGRRFFVCGKFNGYSIRFEVNPNTIIPNLILCFYLKMEWVTWHSMLLWFSLLFLIPIIIVGNNLLLIISTSTNKKKRYASFDQVKIKRSWFCKGGETCRTKSAIFKLGGQQSLVWKTLGPKVHF